jgi:hypothetical protein
MYRQISLIYLHLILHVSVLEDKVHRCGFFLCSNAYLTRAAVSTRLATVIITGGVLNPASFQAFAVSSQSLQKGNNH